MARRPSPRGGSARIDAYLATLDEERRATLTRLRATIRAIVPEAEECISYGMPAFRVDGAVVAGFLATGPGCSYFPFSGSILAGLAAELGRHDRTKSALHFPATGSLSSALVRKLLGARLAEVRARRAASTGRRRRSA